MSAHQCTYFSTYRKLEAFVVVIGLCTKAQFDGNFQESGSKLVLFKMVYGIQVGKGQPSTTSLKIYISVFEENIAGTYTYAKSHAQFRVAFKRLVQHKISIKAPRKTFDTATDAIGNIQPMVAAELYHQMVARAIAKVHFRGGFLVLSACDSYGTNS